jgi:hypothetical protein
MELTSFHKDMISTARRYYIETGTLKIEAFNMTTKDFYIHFPGGLRQVEGYLDLDIKEK